MNNPYSITQAPDRLRLAGSLQQHAAVLNIRLIETAGTCKKALGEKGASAPFNIAAEFRAETGACGDRRLRINTHFSFKLISEQEKIEVIALQCVMEAEYVLAEGFQPTPEQIEAFREGPAIFNCWPFFREYVQSTVMRMNYPPPPIPFLWLEVKRIETDSAVNAADASSEPTKTTRKSAQRKISEGV